MRALEFIRDHVTFKIPYDFSYHMKTPIVVLSFLISNFVINKFFHGRKSVCKKSTYLRKLSFRFIAGYGYGRNLRLNEVEAVGSMRGVKLLFCHFITTENDLSYYSIVWLYSLWWNYDEKVLIFAVNFFSACFSNSL